MTTRYRLLIEYDGRPYMGWQRQAHGATVQGALERAIHDITAEQAVVHAAGRTDAGVHATAMTAHTDIEKPMSAFRLQEALNARLKFAGEAVAILSVEAVADDFHARFSCIGRAYEYRLLCRRAPLTWNQGLVWRRPNPLDLGAMREAAVHLVGRHDFTTFRHVHCQAKSAIRTLDRLDIEQRGAEIVIHAEARSFLHHQVRSMTGALVFAGEGRCTPDDVRAALERRNRAALRLNAPPDGLWFVGAHYARPVG